MDIVSTSETTSKPASSVTEKYSKEFRIKGMSNPSILHNFIYHIISAAIFLASVSGISALIGFGSTLAAAKKQDPTNFGKGFIPTKELHETGSSLALRALGWGTLYAVTGCGLLFYSIWKLSGARNVYFN